MLVSKMQMELQTDIVVIHIEECDEHSQHENFVEINKMMLYRNGHIGLGKQCRPRLGSSLFAFPFASF